MAEPEAKKPETKKPETDVFGESAHCKMRLAKDPKYGKENNCVHQASGSSRQG
jgi:hypothetical protein